MYQSGFRTNYSTEFCLAQLIDFVLTGMIKQMHTRMRLVDLHKPFDSLDLGVIFEKMKYFCFRISLIKLFESYLSNRKCLLFVDVLSENGTLKYGAPQGSILGPLLVLLYVNNLTQLLLEASSYSYEDGIC